MNENMSVLNLVLNASLVVQIIMALLLLASLASWVIIFRKRQVMARARKLADKFEERFWSGADLTRLYQEVSEDRAQVRGLENIFEAGFREFARARQGNRPDPKLMMDRAERAMRVALHREVDRLDSHLSFLATVGSVSPYVGLFGTVWGIMTAFYALGNVSQATIAMVAPGISEALIATAMGLFAAIPAVIAFNRFANEVDRLQGRYDAFAEEFSSLLHRQAHLE